jgi:hypothetical protein
MSDGTRELLADEVESAQTVFVVYEDQNGDWGRVRDTNRDGYRAVSSALVAAITAREYARDFLDDVDANDPNLRKEAEDVFAKHVEGSGGRR